MKKHNTLIIYYDGDCPFCKNYTKLLRLKSNVETVKLINLREVPEKISFYNSQGLNVDEGMIVETKEQTFHGSEAINLLAKLSSDKNLFNKINSKILSNPTVSNMSYPFLKAGRNITLFFLGKQSLIAEKQSPLLLLFSWLWATFSVLHFLVYATQFNSTLYWSTYGILIFGLIGVFKPQSIRVFCILIIMGVIDAWQQMPAYSNHTIIKNFLLLSIVFASLSTLIKSKTRADFINCFAPCARILLLTMYFFGVFHKINSDFLNPSVSCAVTLLERIPLGFENYDSLWIHYSAIYGTLIIESLIFIALITPNWRKTGIFLGIGFHSLLALSGYAFYAPFSMLTIVLHVFFLTSDEANQIIKSKVWKLYFSRLNSIKGVFLIGVWFLSIYYFATISAYSFASTLWLVFIPFLMYLLINSNTSVSKPNEDSLDAKSIKFISTEWTINLISVFFIFNCLTPYLGLKTSQSINMFANLQLENSKSNHLIFSKPPWPFDYLEDLVLIDDGSGSSYFNYVQNENYYITYYDLLDKLERSPSMLVSYTRNGQSFKNHSAQILKSEIDAHLHPRWFRNWFHFTPVNLTSPEPCSLSN